MMSPVPFSGDGGTVEAQAARPMERLDVAKATCEELIERIPSNGSELEAGCRGEFLNGIL